MTVKITKNLISQIESGDYSKFRTAINSVLFCYEYFCWFEKPIGIGLLPSDIDLNRDYSLILDDYERCIRLFIIHSNIVEFAVWMKILPSPLNNIKQRQMFELYRQIKGEMELKNAG